MSLAASRTLNVFGASYLFLSLSDSLAPVFGAEAQHEVADDVVASDWALVVVEAGRATRTGPRSPKAELEPPLRAEALPRGSNFLDAPPPAPSGSNFLPPSGSKALDLGAGAIKASPKLASRSSASSSVFFGFCFLSSSFLCDFFFLSSSVLSLVEFFFLCLSDDVFDFPDDEEDFFCEPPLDVESNLPVADGKSSSSDPGPTDTVRSISAHVSSLRSSDARREENRAEGPNGYHHVWRGGRARPNIKKSPSIRSSTSLPESEMTISKHVLSSNPFFFFSSCRVENKKKIVSTH